MVGLSGQSKQLPLQVAHEESRTQVRTRNRGLSRGLEENVTNNMHSRMGLFLIMQVAWCLQMGASVGIIGGRCWS